MFAEINLNRRPNRQRQMIHMIDKIKLRVTNISGDNVLRLIEVNGKTSFLENFSGQRLLATLPRLHFARGQTPSVWLIFMRLAMKQQNLARLFQQTSHHFKNRLKIFRRLNANHSVSVLYQTRTYFQNK